MEIEFDFRKEISDVFGEIYRPVAKLTLTHKDVAIPQIFYVDSGADITLIPKSIGEILMLDHPRPSEIFDIMGIGDKGISIVLRKVAVTLGNSTALSRIGWALTEDVPLLLGREDFFPLYDIRFQKNRKTVFVQ